MSEGSTKHELHSGIPLVPVGGGIYQQLQDNIGKQKEQASFHSVTTTGIYPHAQELINKQENRRRKDEEERKKEHKILPMDKNRIRKISNPQLAAGIIALFVTQMVAAYQTPASAYPMVLVDKPTNSLLDPLTNQIADTKELSNSQAIKNKGEAVKQGVDKTIHTANKQKLLSNDEQIEYEGQEEDDEKPQLITDKSTKNLARKKIEKEETLEEYLRYLFSSRKIDIYEEVENPDIYLMDIYELEKYEVFSRYFSKNIDERISASILKYGIPIKSEFEPDEDRKGLLHMRRNLEREGMIKLIDDKLEDGIPVSGTFIEINGNEDNLIQKEDTQQEEPINITTRPALKRLWHVMEIIQSAIKKYHPGSQAS